ncbi:TIGR04076 family protein [Candidatus Bathyarchaeota archaeon]|nr:TIGR04076 family protein [Candidatus Bathyarchaeota archaeon]
MVYYKVVATVHKVSRPQSLTPDQPSHVFYPCRMYKEGDRIVFEDNQINMAETTGALCLSLVASLIPVLKAMQRKVEPIIEEDGSAVPDSTQKVTWFSCPDAERPVILKIERVPMEGKPGWIIADKLAKSKHLDNLHFHTPNPNDKLNNIYDNLWESVMQKD